VTDLPAPPVPADCDLRGMPGFMLDTERLLASELWALSDGQAFKAAVALWCRSWRQVPASSLPDDDAVLRAFSGLTAAAWKKCRDIALRGFVRCADGRLYHMVLAEDAARAWKARQVQRGKANKRWGNATAMPRHEPNGGSDVFHGNAAALPKQCQGQGQGQGQGDTLAPLAASVHDPAAVAAPFDLPSRLRDAYREIAQAEGGGPVGFARATAALSAARRIFRTPTEGHLRETYRAAAEAGMLDRPPADWPDFRQRIRQDRQAERSATTATNDPERQAALAALDAR
jgi:hypothetical protein